MIFQCNKDKYLCNIKYKIKVKNSIKIIVKKLNKNQLSRNRNRIKINKNQLKNKYK